MHTCQECDKTFTSHRGLNGHKRVHGESKGGYSEPRTWDDSKKQPIVMFNCLQCGQAKRRDVAHTKGKYCSNKCQADYQWENIDRPRVEAGGGGNMRRYLIETQGYQCSIPGCGVSEHMGKPLTLQLDHIDGDSDNNHPTNCRLLCPNCHTQTPTYGGKNKSNSKRNVYMRKYKAERTQKRSAW
jgi:hypothetical protein